MLDRRSWGVLAVLILGIVGPMVGSVAPGEAPAVRMLLKSFHSGSCDESFTIRAKLRPDPRMVDRTAGGACEARLAFHWQPDSSGYCAVFARRGIRLLKFVRGHASDLTASEPWPAEPRPEIKVAVQRRGALIRLRVGRRVVATASDADFAGGKAAFWTSRADLCCEDARYQPRGRIDFSDDFMRAQVAPLGPWEMAVGHWEVQGARGEPKAPPTQLTVNPFSLNGATKDAETALCITGHWFWDDYSIAAAVRPERAGRVGLCVYYQDSANYVLFRWSEGLTEGRREWVSVLDGREEILAERAGGYERGQWYWLEVKACGDEAHAFIDRLPACSARGVPFGQGACGLYVGGEKMSAQFDDVAVRDAPPEAMPFPESNLVPQAYLNDRFMRAWATEQSGWDQTASGEFWHRGAFFSDPSLTIGLPLTCETGASIWAVICADERDTSRGYRLEIQHHVGCRRLTGSLYRKGQLVGSAEIEASEIKLVRPSIKEATVTVTMEAAKRPRPTRAPTANAMRQEDDTARAAVPRMLGASGHTELVFEKKGASLVVQWGGKTVLTYEDRAPLSGRHVAFGRRGWRVLPFAALARCANLMNFTFSAAPVRWRIQRGVWETDPHWFCTGRGAHLMGGDTGPAILWTKDAFLGDLVIEAYVTNAEFPAHYLETPRHLNFTVCGDGANLASGYTFMLGGSGGSEARAFRGDRQVAESRFETWRRSQHNQDLWFNVLIQRHGTRLTFSVDGERLADFDDPSPLDRGHIAIWTYRSRIVLGRLRIWYERKESRQSPPGVVLALARSVAAGGSDVLASGAVAPTPEARPREIVSDFENGFGTFTTRASPDMALLMLDTTLAAQGKRSLKVINRTCGGHFTVWAVKRRFDAARHPIIRFAYRAPEDVKLNLYARIERRWGEILFSADPSPVTGLRLGHIEGVVTDARWHHAEFDLLAALRRAGVPGTAVEALAFASPQHVLLRCGLTGNRFGASFHLDDFRLTAAR